MAASANAEQLSTAQRLKRAIVSDFATFVQEQTGHSNSERTDHSNYAVSRLLLFDPMDSPEALGVFASLSGYYLGARAEQTYHCLILRKGKKIEPLLTEQLHGSDLECARELGREFESPSAVLDGKALCRSKQDEASFLARVISEVDSGRTCSNSDLAEISQGTREMNG